MKIKSAAAVRREEELIRRAKEASRRLPRTSDRTDYEANQKAMHDKALEIRAYLAENYPDYVAQHPVLKQFRGAYGWASNPESKEVKLVMDLAKEKVDTVLLVMLLELQEADREMLYEADALCIQNPEPFYTAWEDELGPYKPTTPTNAVS